ncbi:hypothetical protein BDW22DRAFT_1361312 [Trametopsis cervina]|nr:hypothetical protein BDW22DRAFT_1361312 [Trametopsis cervina]
MPYLEVLELKGMLPWRNPQETTMPTVSEPIVLSHLTTLIIGGSLSRCSLFLPQIDAPCLLELRIRGVVTSDPGFTAFGAALAAMLGTLPLLSLVVDESYGPAQTRLAAWTSLDPFPLNPAASQEDGVRSVYVTLIHESARHVDVPLRAPSLLPIGGVRALHVGLDYARMAHYAKSDLSAWRHAFGALGDVERLHVYGTREPVPFAAGQASEEPQTRFIRPSGRRERTTRRYTDTWVGVSVSHWQKTMVPTLSTMFPRLKVEEIHVNGRGALTLKETCFHSYEGEMMVRADLSHRRSEQHVL